MASQKYAENSTENELTSDTLIPWGEALSIPDDKSAKIYTKKNPLGYDLLTCNEPSKFPSLSRSDVSFVISSFAAEWNNCLFKTVWSFFHCRGKYFKYNVDINSEIDLNDFKVTEQI